MSRVFIWYGPGPSGMSFWHSGNLPSCVLLLCYVSYMLFLGGGSTGQWWGWGPFLWF